MADSEWIRKQANISFKRVWPRLEQEFEAEAKANPAAWQGFELRLGQEWERLFGLLLHLYGQKYDFFYHLERLIAAAARSWLDRPEELKELDRQREADPHWYHSNQALGGVLYVDLFAGNLAALHDHIPYFKELGLTYLHLMPLFEAPEGNSDGGYAISSYRAVNPALGSMEELKELATALREEGITLVLDFVFNHTSDEHEWARWAQEGDPEYMDYYFIFPDRSEPDQYDPYLREIFPTVRRGSFTFHEGMRQWVWTTFNSFQWDLNYSNPGVFRAIAEEMLFLANVGVEVLRMDAVAFIWKRKGTDCEGQPEAHLILQAFNAVARIAAPALLFKSEAIVHPDEVLSYISPQECQISYNPLLMALLWEALATRQVKLLAHSMRTRWQIPPGTGWVNYLRCHDDIGWTFDDADAAHLGINGFNHRLFLNAFYTGHFEGSFASGLPFQENPDTGDARISGTLASLAGLEQALLSENQREMDLSLQRILMLHSIILTIGGVPLIYFGDEIGTLNDYTYIRDAAKAGDSRWVHRAATDWEQIAQRHEPTPLAGRLYSKLLRLIKLRQSQPALWNGDMQVIDCANPHLFGYVRQHDGERLLIVSNFCEHPQTMSANGLRIYGLAYRFRDLITGSTISATEPLYLAPYQFVWLQEHT
ncbi:MAG: alpha-amylase family glycosyl hydrolase [Ardenticatenaceae bacterium]